jgi:hypothetical protein
MIDIKIKGTPEDALHELKELRTFFLQHLHLQTLEVQQEFQQTIEDIDSQIAILKEMI